MNQLGYKKEMHYLFVLGLLNDSFMDPLGAARGGGGGGGGGGGELRHSRHSFRFTMFYE